MIWQAWAVLTLIAAGSSYLAMVAKRAPVYCSLVAIGTSIVAALGAMGGLETQWATTGSAEYGIAILLGLNGLAGLAVLLAAATGQFGDQDPDDSPEASMFDKFNRTLGP